jgi:hypothetical protein
VAAGGALGLSALAAAAYGLKPRQPVG